MSYFNNEDDFDEDDSVFEYVAKYADSDIGDFDDDDDGLIRDDEA